MTTRTDDADAQRQMNSGPFQKEPPHSNIITGRLTTTTTTVTMILFWGIPLATAFGTSTTTTIRMKQKTHGYTEQEQRTTERSQQNDPSVATSTTSTVAPSIIINHDPMTFETARTILSRSLELGSIVTWQVILPLAWTAIMQQQRGGVLTLSSEKKKDDNAFWNYALADGSTAPPTNAQRIRLALERMGPTFVKFGQALACRPDIIPPALADALLALQDDMESPFVNTAEMEKNTNDDSSNQQPPPRAETVIRRELESKQVDPAIIDAVLDSLSSEPIASASIGVVYRARLVNGRQVAIKLKRPEIAHLVAQDAAVLQWIAQLVEQIPALPNNNPNNNRLIAAQVSQAVEEFMGRVWEELDYANEVRNLQVFARLYGMDHPNLEDTKQQQIRGKTSSNAVQVVVPRVYEEYCTDEMIVMEWIDGSKMDISTNDPAAELRIVQEGIRCTLSQLFETGVLHADPHLGNILKAQAADGTTRLGYLDFGMLAIVPEQVRDGLTCAIVELVFARDVDAVASLFGELQLLPESVLENPNERKALAQALENAIDMVLVFPETNDQGSVPTLRFDNLLSALFQLVTRFQLQLPPYFLNNARALATLEGIARRLDPSFNVLQVVYPFVLDRLLRNPTMSPVVERTILKLIRYPETGKVDRKRTKRLLGEVSTLTGERKRKVVFDTLSTAGGRRLSKKVVTEYLRSKRDRISLTEKNMVTEYRPMALPHQRSLFLPTCQRPKWTTRTGTSGFRICAMLLICMNLFQKCWSFQLHTGFVTKMMNLGFPRHTRLWTADSSTSNDPLPALFESPQQADAVVCGGGPAGLLTAIMLAQKLPSDQTIRVYDRLSAPPNPDDETAWSDVAKFYLIGIGGRGQSALKEFGVWESVKQRCVPVLGRRDWQPEGPEEGVENIFSKKDKRTTTQVLPRDKLVGVLHSHICENYSDRIILEYGYELAPLDFDYKNGTQVLIQVSKCSDEVARMNPSVVKVATEEPVDVLCDTDSAQEVATNLLIAADGTVRTIANAIQELDEKKYAKMNSVQRIFTGKPFHVKRYVDDNQRVYKTIPINMPADWRFDVNYSARSAGGKVNFDALPANRNGQYCGALLLKKEDPIARAGVDPKEMRRRLDESLPQFSKLLSDEDVTKIATKPISYLPGFRYVGPRLRQGNRCLILGDCAHTVKPYFGLGANSALQDVSILGQILDKNDNDFTATVLEYSRKQAPQAKALVRLSRDLDRPGKLGVLTFLAPIILDSIFHKAFPKVFAPNIIQTLQREEYTFTQVARRKRLDRFGQLSIIGSVLAGMGILTQKGISLFADRTGLKGSPLLGALAGSVASMVVLKKFVSLLWTKFIAQKRDKGLSGEKIDGKSNKNEEAVETKSLHQRVSPFTIMWLLFTKYNLPAWPILLLAGASTKLFREATSTETASQSPTSLSRRRWIQQTSAFIGGISSVPNVSHAEDTEDEKAWFGQTLQPATDERPAIPLPTVSSTNRPPTLQGAIYWPVPSTIQADIATTSPAALLWVKVVDPTTNTILQSSKIPLQKIASWPFQFRFTKLSESVTVKDQQDLLVQASILLEGGTDDNQVFCGAFQGQGVAKAIPLQNTSKSDNEEAPQAVYVRAAAAVKLDAVMTPECQRM